MVLWLYGFGDPLKLFAETVVGFIPCPQQYAFYLVSPSSVLFNCVDSFNAMVCFSTQLLSIFDDRNGMIGVDGVTSISMDDHLLMIPLKLHSLM